MKPVKAGRGRRWCRLRLVTQFLWAEHTAKAVQRPLRDALSCRCPKNRMERYRTYSAPDPIARCPVSRGPARRPCRPWRAKNPAFGQKEGASEPLFGSASHPSHASECVRIRQRAVAAANSAPRASRAAATTPASRCTIMAAMLRDCCSTRRFMNPFMVTSTSDCSPCCQWVRSRSRVLPDWPAVRRSGPAL
jgi:hypothetical protein